MAADRQPEVPPGSAMMAMFFSSAEPVIVCLTDLCGESFRGQSSSGAWQDWYDHLAGAHPGWGS
jgi:hypothetical protein